MPDRSNFLNALAFIHLVRLGKLGSQNDECSLIAIIYVCQQASGKEASHYRQDNNLTNKAHSYCSYSTRLCFGG